MSLNWKDALEVGREEKITTHLPNHLDLFCINKIAIVVRSSLMPSIQGFRGTDD